MIKFKNIVIILVLVTSINANSQISMDDACAMYNDVLLQIKLDNRPKYWRHIYVANKIILIDNFINYLKSVRKSFGDSIENRGIEINQFINYTTDTFTPKCLSSEFKLKSFDEFYEKMKKKKWKKIAFCYLSNIAFYGDYAFFKIVILSNFGAKYHNFYFFKKENGWKLICSRVYLP